MLDTKKNDQNKLEFKLLTKYSFKIYLIFLETKPLITTETDVYSVGDL